MNQHPTYFELVAQDNLKPLLDPALKVLFSSTHSLLIDNYWPLLFHSLTGILECATLHEADASFSEYYYGLKRVRASGEKLDYFDKLKSLCALSVFPIISEKAHDMYKQAQVAEDLQSLGDDDVPESRKDKLKKLFFMSIYPILRSGLLTIDLLFQWNYLFTNSNTPKFFSLLNYLLGIKIVRLTAQDYARARAPQSNIFKFLFKKLTLNTLTVVLLGFRLVEWWQMMDSNFRNNLVKGTDNLLPIPPPPPPIQPHENGIPIPKQASSVCPICCEKRTNPTVLKSSGYVFCYPCIFNSVQEHKRCPVTLLESDVGMLLRIYNK